MTRFALILVALLAASPAAADFGEYTRHTADGNTLTIGSSRGELHITAVDDAAFELHYVEEGVSQLPSFALAGEPGAFASTIEENDDAITFSIDGLTAVVGKSPVRVSFYRDGKPLVAEEHGYFAFETTRGFRFALDADEKILG
ncbi:MAG: DUF4968 domain-containing protein, partial [Woeseiaceae bacterium]